MAVLVLNDDKKQAVSAEQGRTIWQVLNGEIEPTADQEKFCLRVERVFLNWRNAPDSYVKQNFGLMTDLATSAWICDRDGNLVRPEPTDEPGWRFAKRWGLWENGKPTVLIERLNQQKQMRRWVESSKPG